MEGFVEALKLWVPFAGFCVAFFALGWRVVNRREDKLEARFQQSMNRSREDAQQREDKLEERFQQSMNMLREDARQRDNQLEARIDSAENRLEARIDSTENRLEARIDETEKRLEARIDETEGRLVTRMDEGFGILRDSIDQLRNDIQQINARMDANARTFHTDISKLAEKIETNSHDLRVELAQLNQNHVNHLEHHEEIRQRAEN